ncbi:hypothetical protein FisN_6Lh061 [Fistulifera solaris]|uniref:Uncharacterized protein n=1 Tax=Fistulifera solaris TaxID=1519565 RepID=A0A1Z5KPU1_FISSO|nr:hypothetical protein FisN_6Lh061 [Fistulifera solaris]|eukprot:GAX28122.1 hypothetical protein FisN_6Lh061 [Fistulifera solaris]
MRPNGASREYNDDEKRIAAALALRSFHLPEYSLLQDWWQYMVNHHPVWGICCHHRLHPLELKMRLLYFVGSVMFGLAVTNGMWLIFIWAEVDEQQAVLTIRFGEQKYNDDLTAEYNQQPEEDAGLLFQNDGEVIITRGMILLWTIGGTLHAFFDQTIWLITTCACCLPGQALECCLFARQYTRILAVVAVVFTTAVATLAVLLRASVEEQAPTNSSDTNTVEEWYYQGSQRIGQITQQSISAYDFLLTYGTELCLSYFVYYPLLGTLFFSGILGCYRIPVLGGRPYEIQQEERRKQRRQNSWRRSS